MAPPKGFKHTAEARAKISEANKRRYAIKRNKARGEGSVYWQVFLETKEPPYLCDNTTCNQEVLLEELRVHHRNGNHEDHSPDNLGAMHNSCHTSHHFKGKLPKNFAQFQALGDAARTGTPRSDEVRMQISAGLKQAYAEGRR